MKIFLLHDPRLFTECARFSHVGTWTRGRLCEKCEQPTSKLIEPLKIEWEPDSDVICDFSWCGYVAAIREHLGKILQEVGFEFNLGAVEYVQSLEKSEKKIVPYPYVGPELRWLKPSVRIPVNEKESGIDVIIDCDECGQKKYMFKTKGIMIDKANWKGEKMFYIDQFGRSRATFVTEEAAGVLKEMSITNIALSEAGEIY